MSATAASLSPPLAFLLALFLTTTAVPLEAQQVVVRVGTDDATGVNPGAGVELPVVVDRSGSDGIQLSRLELSLSWDPALLSFASADAGEAGELTIDESGIADGLLGVTLTGLAGSPSTFTALTLELTGGEADGRSRVVPVVTEATDPQDQTVLSSVEEQGLTLCVQLSGIFGDVNADDRVNVLDAQQIARFAAGLPVPNRTALEAFGDVNDDGQINIIDAQQVARFSAGLEVSGRVGRRVGGECRPLTDEPTSPTEDVEVSGEVTGPSLTVPPGVTVTAAGDLTVRVDGPVKIAGTLAGDCVGIEVEGGGDLVVTGRVSNACAGAGRELPVLRLVGDGDLDLQGADLEVAGDLTVLNDPRLTEEDFGAAGTGSAALVPGGTGAVGGGTRDDRGGAARQAASGVCGVSGTVEAMPATDRRGSDGQVGGPGGDASTWRLWCRGTMVLAGATVKGQNGGRGGDGQHQASPLAEATGGEGGDGGRMRVLATGQIAFTGANTVKGGDGGDGGSASATGAADPDPSKAASAVARGGDGGQPGRVEIRGNQGIDVCGGSLDLEVGASGDGGDATARGADGVNAGQRDGGAQAGGDATAPGGKGASSPDRQLLATGSVACPENVALAGGTGGEGGDASVTAGSGGDGDEADKPGAPGGKMEATGGEGGSSQITDLGGALVSDGGDGGDLAFSGAHGGMGWPDCSSVPFVAGGDGGAGGDGSGTAGTGGSGLNAGADGTTTIAAGTGDGGDGGRGGPPGAGGAAGNDAVPTPRNAGGAVFESGQPGPSCLALVLPGSWQGSWTNLTFGSTGGITLDVSLDLEGGVIDLTLDLDGNVFGAQNPPEESFTAQLPAPGAENRIQFTSGTLGTVTITWDENGAFTLTATDVPEQGIDRLDLQGQVGIETIDGDYTITFSDGSTAQGEISLTKQASGTT